MNIFSLNKYLKFLVILALLFTILTCKKTSDNNLNLRKAEVSSNAGSFFIEVYSSESWELSVSFEGDESGWASIQKPSGSGTLKSIICRYDENSSAKSRTAFITANFANGESITKQFTQSKTINGGEGTQLPEDPDWPELVSDIVPGYMEMPRVLPEYGCAFVTHRMNYTSYDSRNYSIFYDAGNIFSRWIAYPLNSNLIGSGSRTNEWDIWDPKIPEQYQPATQDGWGFGNDWARGHQLPSADRLRSGINEMTFYPTNMTIQRARHNSGIWSNLEGEVRAWANECDTLYVVTGAVPSEGDFKTDKAGNRVNVPEGYWKALLSCEFSSEDNKTITDCKAIAFYIDHANFTGSLGSFAMSISDLEEKLDIDLFVNLPENWSAVENKFTPSEWGL